MKRYQNSPPQHRHRVGFTLIELIMVIAIIAALVALLLPALGSVRTTMQITEVRQEISQLEAAIASFKAEYGVEPPSSITLFETAAGWNGTSSTARLSRAKIRAIWPDFQFVTRSVNDDNGNGFIGDMGDDTDDTFTLTGDLCLAFFLGGSFPKDRGYVGFSSDGRNPFGFNSSSSVATRKGPFFDFEAGRLFIGDGTNDYQYFPVYVDTIPDQSKPYAYISSNDGLGYNETDTDNDGKCESSDLRSSFDGNICAYRTATGSNATYWKPNSYQIISPGFDGEYGLGGAYLPDSNIPLPLVDDPADATERNQERDNITNFTSGTLSN
ncbi:prepilin-type N-terminal cleavage/methylation domain-containing protein [Planctomycetaceae bacterium]|nr:prepilin-type N-terminal cleavage/methylation domain-containing protein [Planctomycetaceae bacterium]